MDTDQINLPADILRRTLRCEVNLRNAGFL